MDSEPSSIANLRAGRQKMWRTNSQRDDSPHSILSLPGQSKSPPTISPSSIMNLVSSTNVDSRPNNPSHAPQASSSSSRQDDIHIALTGGLERESPPLRSGSGSTGKTGRYSVSRTSACERCRIAKAKCSQDRPVCARCRMHAVSCVYDKPQRRRPSVRDFMNKQNNDGKKFAPSGSQTSPHDVTTEPPLPQMPMDSRQSPSQTRTSPIGDPNVLNDRLASRQELMELLTTYFSHVYPVQAMAFIHKAQLFRRVEEGRASPLLIKAMCAVSARFLPSADHKHTEGGFLPSVWCQEAKVGITLDTDRFSLSKLAAILCILTHDFNCGRTGSAWIFVAIAVRMARAMGLNVESTDPNISFIEKETRRRLIWAVFCADCFCSAGWPEYMLISAEEIQVYLPSDENSFTLGIEKPGVRLVDLIDGWKDDVYTAGRTIGSLMTRWIWLMALRINLLTYVWKIHDHPLKPWNPESHFGLIVRRLGHWKDTLPHELQFTVDNLHLRKGTHELDSIAVMHICFDIIHATMYRITLPNFPESARPEFLALAPREWIHRLRYAANVRAVAVRQKFALLEKHFPEHVPTTRLYNLYIFGSLRVQLQYLALSAPDGIPDPQSFEETANGFECMMQVVAKMIRYYVDNRRVLRDLLQILARHGYSMAGKWEEELRFTDGIRTPMRLGYAVSGIPRHPARNLELRANPSTKVDFAGRAESGKEVIAVDPVDPVSNFVKDTKTDTMGLEYWADLFPAQNAQKPPVPASSQSTSNFGNLMFQNPGVSPGDDLATLVPSFDVSDANQLNLFGAWDPFVGAMPHAGPSDGGMNQSGMFPGGLTADGVFDTWTAETSDIDWDALISETQRGETDPNPS